MKLTIYLLLSLLSPAYGQTQSGESTSLFTTEITEAELNKKLKSIRLQDQEGMRFTVPNDQLRSDYGTKLLKFSSSSPRTDTYTTITCGEVVGKVFTLEKLVSRTLSDRECTLAVLKNEGDYYATVIGDKLADVKNSTYQRSVPGMVNLSLIEEARKYLVGRKMFSQRNSPHDTDTTNSAFSDNNDYIYLPRFVPVTIRKVEPGQRHLPFKITIEYMADNLVHVGQYSFGEATGSDGRQFTDYYGFSDHRAEYKGLSKTAWRALQDGTPARGMTMKECELVMGKPDRKLESFDGKQINEWYYESTYGKSWNILFIDGKVDRFLNYER